VHVQHWMEGAHPPICAIDLQDLWSRHMDPRIWIYLGLQNKYLLAGSMRRYWICFFYKSCNITDLKQKKLKNQENNKKNNKKNQTVKKNRLNQLKFWKNRPVRFGFGFISLKPKKSNRTEPKPEKNWAKPEKNRAKLKKTEQNWFEQVFVLKNRTEPKPAGLNRFRFRFFLNKKILVWLFFYI
jgi:hypothetical protein